MDYTERDREKETDGERLTPTAANPLTATPSNVVLGMDATALEHIHQGSPPDSFQKSPRKTTTFALGEPDPFTEVDDDSPGEGPEEESLFVPGKVEGQAHQFRQTDEHPDSIKHVDQYPVPVKESTPASPVKVEEEKAEASGSDDIAWE